MKEKLIKDLLALEEEIEIVQDKKEKAKLKRKFTQIEKVLKKVFTK